MSPEGGDSGSVCFPDGCAGLTSKISKVDVVAGSKSDFITGLLSLGDETGFFSIGATGVAVQGNQVFALMGGNPIAVPPLSACPGSSDPANCPAAIAAAANLGGVLRAVPSGGFNWKQNVGAFNYQWVVDNNGTIPLPGWKSCDKVSLGDPCNPDFTPGDANPYAMAAAPGGNHVVDGGANTLTWVPANGTPTVLAALPNPTGLTPTPTMPCRRAWLPCTARSSSPT